MPIMSDVFKNEETTPTYNHHKAENKVSTAARTKRKVWKIFPPTIASLMCLPFGIMLGWPSPTYPKLLPKFAPNPPPISINIDQSAMIAGFLMIGNTIGTPFSSVSIVGAKYGIFTGLILMLAGWILMRFANSIYFLLGSRLLVGLGCGYGVGQLKIYIKDMCQPPYTQLLTKLIAFHTFFGVIVAFILGCVTNFRQFSTVTIIITAVIGVLCLLLPHTPKEYLMFGKVDEAKTVLVQVKQSPNVDSEVLKLEKSLEESPDSLGFIKVMKEKYLRKGLIIICMLTIAQQCTGAPATIVYAQIIFSESKCPYPEVSAIAYSILFFISNFIATFYFSSFNKKTSLLFSSISVTLTLILNVLVFYFNLNENYWRYTSLISMFLFIFVHSAGLAVMPFLLVQEYFPPDAVTAVSKFQTMQHSMLALIITKIFQVLYDKFDLYVPFCLFLGVSVLSNIFIWVIVPYNTPVFDVSINKPLKKSSQLLSTF